VKAKAKELMFSGENHLTLIFSLIVISVSAVIPLFVFSLIYTFYPYIVIDIAMMAMEFFVLAPLLFGLLSLITKMADGERVHLTDLFEGFSSFKAYTRSLCLGLVSVIIVALLVLFVSLPLMASSWMKSAGLPAWICYSAGIVGTVVTSVIAILSACRMCLFPIFVAKGNGIYLSFTRSLLCTRKKTAEILMLALSFLPLVIVSALMVLVPMLIYTAPYLLSVWAVGAKTICENNE
jgi:hypothetical protein